MNNDKYSNNKQTYVDNYNSSNDKTALENYMCILNRG